MIPTRPIVSARCLFAAAGLAFVAPAGAAAAEASSAIPAKAAVPASCGVQLKAHNFTPQVLQQVSDMGFTAVRRGLYWKAVEREKGEYDFSEWDEPMAKAKALDLTVIMVLFSGHPAYGETEGGIQTEAGRRGFAAFAAAAAAHYKDQPVIWEVWNEPNVRTFWRKDGKHNSDAFATEYTDLVKVVAPAVLKADPDACVVAGAVSNYWEPSYYWTEACFKRGILDTGIRGWSVHPYGVKTPEEFTVGHTRTRALLEKYGHGDMPMVNTERGFSVKERAEGWSGGSKPRAREFQGWHLVRQFIVDQLNGVTLTVWYQWDGDTFGLMPEGGAAGEPWPAHAAAEVMLDQLDGYALAGRVESSLKLDYAVLYRHAGGGRKLVAWTAAPPNRSPDATLPHEVTIAVEGELPGGPIRGVDINGKPVTAAVTDGAIRVKLDGGPQYLELPDGVTPVSMRPTEPIDPAAWDAKPKEVPDDAAELWLFDEGADWAFVKNTGEGSFSLGEDGTGQRIGTLKYDFSGSEAESRPYVLAKVDVSIDGGHAFVWVQARSPIEQQLTFRLVDKTGQTHQYKKVIDRPHEWVAVGIPLTGRLEHWGGAKDGKIHFPIKQLVVAVPRPKDGHPAGRVEYTGVAVSGGE